MLHRLDNGTPRHPAPPARRTLADPVAGESCVAEEAEPVDLGAARWAGRLKPWQVIAGAAAAVSVAAFSLGMWAHGLPTPAAVQSTVQAAVKVEHEAHAEEAKATAAKIAEVKAIADDHETRLRRVEPIARDMRWMKGAQRAIVKKLKVDWPDPPGDDYAE